MIIIPLSCKNKSLNISIQFEWTIVRKLQFCHWFFCWISWLTGYTGLFLNVIWLTWVQIILAVLLANPDVIRILKALHKQTICWYFTWFISIALLNEWRKSSILKQRKQIFNNYDVWVAAYFNERRQSILMKLFSYSFFLCKEM